MASDTTLNKAMAHARVSLGVAELSLKQATEASEYKGDICRHLDIADAHQNVKQALKHFVTITNRHF